MNSMRGRSRTKATVSKTSSTSMFMAAASAAGLSPAEGKQAIQHQYRSGIQAADGSRFCGSVDLDAAFARAEPHASRWDYGLGIQRNGVELAFWVEPHPASSTSEVARMIAKLDWLKAKLSQPAFSRLNELTRNAMQLGLAFRWLAASGEMRLVPGSRQARLLAERGIAFPTRHLRLP